MLILTSPWKEIRGQEESFDVLVTTPVPCRSSTLLFLPCLRDFPDLVGWGGVKFASESLSNCLALMQSAATGQLFCIERRSFLSSSPKGGRRPA